jgi:uncharacterized membrane protein SpoIIM required for sporulation/uncharacterized RDD family membrane protein YckC
VGSRAAAAVIDAAILLVVASLILLVFLGVPAAGETAGSWVAALSIALMFALPWAYFTLFEAFRGGRTPGKKRLGIRVVMATGHPVTFGAAATRNLVRIVDAQPGLSFGVGFLFVLFHGQNKRLGDMAAGTIVVRDGPDELALGPSVEIESQDESFALEQPVLDDDEYRLLDQLVTRLDALDAPRRRQFVRALASRFADRFPAPPGGPEDFILEVHDLERRRRRSRFAARQASGTGQSVKTAESFVARKQGVWEDFRRRIVEVEANRLGSLDEKDVTRLAASYREVAADLARARTYGVDPRVVDHLARLVGAGHNVLYASRGTGRPKMGRLLLREFPGALVEARRYVLAAFGLFLLPGVVGFVLIRERPPLAREVLPDIVIARAEAGLSQNAAGRGYAEAPSPYLPMVASSIVANNLQVAFSAFAFGITAGVGTVIVLIFNGLFFGAVLGMFANYGLAGWLLTFVAGHGVLELFAIFTAGGAGLVLARAIVAPGDLSRRDALVLGGRLAIRLVGVATVMLILAGVIEGFLSASAAPPGLKLGVSGASLLLLALYCVAGVRAHATSGADPKPHAVGAGGSIRS